MQKADVTMALSTWASLNQFMGDASVGDCVQLLKAEAAGKRRKQFMLRIHSRLNKVRADTERLELQSLVTVPGSKARFLEKWR